MDKVLHAAFTAGDADASGTLTPAEFDVAMKSLHDQMVANAPKNAPAPPPETATDAQKAAARATAFTTADANGDGVLSFDEFKVAAKLLAPHHRPPPQ
jgi:Ca2+-binding EF-hand superfamily protein